jgi:hypothetical protein
MEWFTIKQESNQKAEQLQFNEASQVLAILSVGIEQLIIIYMIKQS